MLSPGVIPAPRRVRRKRKAFAPTATPGAPLVLVAASYEVGAAVYVEFDRPVNIAGTVGSAFILNDGPSGFQYEGVNSIGQPTPTSVSVDLTGIGECDGDVLLTASAENGIVAVDDGGTWEGVSALVLPFP